MKESAAARPDARRRSAELAASLWPAPLRALDMEAAVARALALDASPGPDRPLHLENGRRVELAVHGVLLAAWIAHRRAARGAPGLLVGLNGGQGSGKSTLSALAREALTHLFGLRVLVLSLDDLYLTRAERAALARQVHPLLATRGVPGTHDVRLGMALLDALTDPERSAPVRVPRFDKAVDDRRPEGDWERVAAPVDVVIFEGWCVGASAEADAALVAPCNALEAAEDAEGTWRRYVNEQLAGPYAALFARLDGLVMLKVPDFAAVLRWRGEQEARLRATVGAGMDDAAIARFVAHYERVTRHQLATLPEQADLRLDLDAGHAVVAVSGRAGRP
ncbi:MAG: hypothetical protein V2J24_09620 [Pseudomonadales bacterium]|nr:hypothetical protein [Pseudomonadales bacterium]